MRQPNAAHLVEFFWDSKNSSMDAVCAGPGKPSPELSLLLWVLVHGTSSSSSGL
ncbi:hypothetical protein ACFOEY_00850 [Paracandidimonas soli]|uniref:hypothetical protein n=1 Tax=Paracandidimonas soli TaxID=1917182 RepID=UPI00360745BD